MCGIVFIHRTDGKKSATKMAIKRYRAQKSRGSDGFGFIAIDDGIIREYVRTEKEDDIVKHLESLQVPDVIFHHRYPTSTPNFSQAAHPIKVSHPSLDHDYYVIHNGVIWNDKALKAKHEALGFRYTTEIVQKYESNGQTIFEDVVFNDSEALAIELAIDIDKNGIGVDVKGSIAFVVLQTKKGSTKTEKVYFGRNEGSPLKMDKMKNSFVSITSAGAGDMVPVDKLFELDYKSGKITKRDYLVGEIYHTSAYPYSSYAGQGQIGFSTNDYTEIDNDFTPISEYVDEDMEHYQLVEEYKDLQKKLADIHDPYSEEAVYYQERLLDIEDEIEFLSAHRYETRKKK